MTEKKPQPFDRLARLVRSSLQLAVRVTVAGFARVKRLFVKAKSAGELRVSDKARQAGIRRELRGLPAEHDPAHTGPQPS